MLKIIVQGLWEDLIPKIPDKQVIQYHPSWNAPIGEPDDPSITISQISDRRYALAKFSLEDMTLSCKLILFTRWFQSDKEMKIDIGEPKGFDKLCRWLYIEALDGIRYGRHGKHNDSFRLRLSARYSRNPQPPLYHQKSLPFLEEQDGCEILSVGS